MQRRAAHFRASWLLILSVAAACGREPVSAPAAVRLIVDASSGTPGEYAYVQEQITALTSLLAKNGGLDQLLSRGADTALIAQRRQRVESDLAAARAHAGEMEKGRSGASPVFAAIVQEEAGAPPCLVNLSLNGCFLDWYSTINHQGSGTVYQWASSLFHHGTATFITDNGNDVGTRTTSGFALTATHSKSYSFTPADPNCLSGDHDIRETTSHEITLGIHDIGFAHGHQTSSDHSQCFRKYLTVSVSPGEVGVGESASITVGHLPAGGCAYGVTSSDNEIASIQHPGEGIWAAMGLAGGTVTITARCPDGTSGSTTLTVSGAPPPPPPPPPPAGGGDEEPPGEPEAGCHWERDVIIWSDGSVTWGGPWELVCDTEFATFRAQPASLEAATKKLRVLLVGTGSLLNGRSATVLRSGEPALAATIVIDTLKASAADLEQAFAAAQLLSAKNAPVEPGAILGVVMSEATADARAKNGEGSRAAKYLEELQKATAEIEAKPFGKGRSLEVEVDVKSIRVKRTVPHL